MQESFALLEGWDGEGEEDISLSAVFVAHQGNLQLLDSIKDPVARVRARMQCVLFRVCIAPWRRSVRRVVDVRARRSASRATCASWWRA